MRETRTFRFLISSARSNSLIQNDRYSLHQDSELSPVLCGHVWHKILACHTQPPKCTSVSAPPSYPEAVETEQPVWPFDVIKRLQQFLLAVNAGPFVGCHLPCSRRRGSRHGAHQGPLPALRALQPQLHPCPVPSKTRSETPHAGKTRIKAPRIGTLRRSRERAGADGASRPGGRGSFPRRTSSPIHPTAGVSLPRAPRMQRGDPRRLVSQCGIHRASSCSMISSHTASKFPAVPTCWDLSGWENSALPSSAKGRRFAEGVP